MKVEVNETVERKPTKLPCLMKSKTSSVIILAEFSVGSRNYKGTVVVSSPLFRVGTTKTDWMQDNFKPFEGSITLSND